MSQISARVRLRPIRFAFLAKPNNLQKLLEIFKINTCLWGGKFNPIIPFFRQVPDWWDRRGYSFYTSKQIINGYLDFYEPDFLVESEKRLATDLGYNLERIFQLSDLLIDADDHNWKGNGLNVLDLYKELYLNEFQFERRHKHNIISVIAEDPIYDTFCACIFGGFPNQENLKHFDHAFNDAFDPLKITLNGSTLKELYTNGFTSPLNIGHYKIEVDYDDHGDTTLFVLDATKPQDLIDLWNLRTFRRNILAIPIQWLNVLSDYCRRIIKESYRPIPGNPHGVMFTAVTMFSRSIPHADIEGLYQEFFSVDVPGANSSQDWYPPIWLTIPRNHIRQSRAQLTASEKTFDVQYSEDKSNIRFDSLYPHFAAKYANKNRWANVIKGYVAVNC